MDKMIQDLKMASTRVIQRVKRGNIKIVKVVQEVLIKILLFLTYYIGFGITYLIVFFFKRKLLSYPNKNQESFWIDVKENNPGIEECLRQS